MKTKRLYQRGGGLSLALVLVSLFWLRSLPALADVTRTQTLNLQKGWNAVFLQVCPTNADPAAVFGNLPVTVAATFFPKNTPVQFVSDPSKTSWKKEGWGVWYAPGRSDAFLSTLFTVLGNRGYLLYAERACVWNVSGQVAPEPVRWQNDSFNLVGFNLDPLSPPSFAKFFAASPAHQPLKVFRLVDGHWTQLIDTISTPMRDGEACWVYCQGGSSYQGPLRVKTLLGNSLDFGDTVNNLDLTFYNEAATPMDISIGLAPGANVPLAYQIQQVTTSGLSMMSADLPAKLDFLGQDAKTMNALRLSLRRDRLGTYRQTGLLKVTSDYGTVTWIPVGGNRPDLAGTP